MSGKIIDLPSRGVSLFVKVVGDGYPMLLMHGGLGADHSTLLPIAAARDSFRLIFYDHRCNGRSIGASIDSLSWDNLTADAEALREKLGIEKWAVLGHSFGGMTAMEYAVRYSQSVTHLILMDTGADCRLIQRDAPNVLAERGYKPSKVEAARRLFNGELQPNELTSTMLKLGKAYYHSHGIVMQTRAVISALRIRSKSDACIFGFKHLLKDWSMLSRLPSISVPALLIAGVSDFQFPPKHQMDMANALKNAVYKGIEGSSHNPLIEKPEQTIGFIRQFIRK
jgi:proline iminopeptidase